MDLVTPILIAFVGLLAAVMCAAITPLVKVLALRYGIVDRPDQYRKLHDEATPLGGGLSIVLAIFAAILLMALCEPTLQELFFKNLTSNLGILAAGGLIVGLGLVDDRFGLRGRHKLMGQIAVAAVLIQCGYIIPGIKLFGVQIDLGLLSIPVTLAWLVLSTNALNLIDGIDGLASAVGILLSGTLACLAWLNGHHAAALLLAAMAGAILGFLPYNFPPARMYLGDAGSMLIGLWLGAVSVQSALKGPTAVGLAAPLAVWTVPLFDTLAAVIRRKCTGRSIYSTDRGHLHHCLQQITGNTRRTLYFVMLACVATCIGALTSVAMKSDVFALISALSVVGVLVATRSFGHGELELLVGKTREIVQFLNPMPSRQTISPVEHTIRFQGSRPWEELWNSLLPLTEEFKLTRVRLDVNIPACHENYHVTWTVPKDTDPQPQWEVKLPLCAGSQMLGQLAICGLHDDDSGCSQIAKLLDLLRSFETRFRRALGPNLPDGRRAFLVSGEPAIGSPAISNVQNANSDLGVETLVVH